MKHILMSALLLGLAVSCKKSDHCYTKCDEATEINGPRYEEGSTAHYTISEVKIEDDCLHVTYTSSGCGGETFDMDLVDAGVIMESYPPQRNLKFLLKNEELCDAIVTQSQSFDLTPLQEKGYNKIYLNIAGHKDQLLYEY